MAKFINVHFLLNRVSVRLCILFVFLCQLTNGAKVNIVFHTKDNVHATETTTCLNVVSIIPYINV